jgi:mRNA interferase MazF
VKQGDLLWYAFPPPAGRRPVVVLTRSSAIGYLNAVVVAPVSTTIRNIPSEVALDESDGLPQRSVVNLDNLQTVAKQRLGPAIGHLSSARLRALRVALEFALDFEALG